jgi:ankyrin repeat protein
MCQLKALEECLSPPQLRRALESLPETLYDTYAQMLSRISEENYEIAVRIFHWLIFSFRPLRVEQLAELAAVDFDGDPPVVERFWDPGEILRICPGLITTVEEHYENGDNEPRILVRLTHISVREYLLSNDIRTSQAAGYQIKEAAAHTSIAECCLLYMQLFEMPPPDAEKEYPLAIYTAENWLYHYDWVPDSAERVHDLAVDFFLKRKKAYSNWLSFFCSAGFPSAPPRFHVDLHDSVSDSPLNVASAYGLLPVLKRMFTSSEIDTSTEPALKGALRSAYLGRLPPRPNAEAIGLLLQHGAHFGGDPRFSYTLHGASYYGFDDVVKMQLERGFDVNTRGGDFGTALRAAVEGRKGPHNYHTSGRHGKPLEDIAPTTVRLLLENGADPNLCDRRKWSPLLTSCAYGDIQCVRLLLDHGADPNFRLETGKGALQRNCLSEACRSGDIRIVKLLLDSGADSRSPGTLTAATRASKIDIMRLFLEAGADPNVIDEGQSEPPLHIACSYCRPELVELLLEYGANPNVTAGQFATPLQIASIYRGSIDILKLLIGKGADVNYVGGRFGTALHCAIWFGDLEMVQYLIDSGADITLQGRPFPSVLRAALQNGHTDIFVLLLKLGADFSIPGGQHGETFRETLASAPPTKTELNFQTGGGNTPSLCVLRRKGASFTDFDNLVLDDHGDQYGAAAADIEWDCVLPKP